MTCSFNTMNETEAVEAGFGSSHEMCNMYIMVYSDEPQYMSCLGNNDDSMGAFETEVGDKSERVEDMSELSLSVVRPGGTSGRSVAADRRRRWYSGVDRRRPRLDDARGSNIWEGGARTLARRRRSVMTPSCV